MYFAAKLGEYILLGIEKRAKVLIDQLHIHFKH